MNSVSWNKSNKSWANTNKAYLVWNVRIGDDKYINETIDKIIDHD